MTCFIFLLSNSLQSQVSVKDFGAVGNGITDDTKAIEKAIEFINSTMISTLQLPNKLKTSSYIGSTKTLIFPQGIYVISKPIILGSYVNVTGENAILIGNDNFNKSTKNIAFDAVSWQTKIEGMQFVGFKTALKIDNKNVDMGKINISNCNFYDNTVAIDLNAKSSITIIENCRFLNNSKSLKIVNGDRVIFTKNWITAGPLSGEHDANIINYGILSFTENLLVPLSPKPGAVEPAWINNYGSVSAEGIRQGGEPGSYTLINNFAAFEKNYPVIPNFVVVKNSDCYASYKIGNTFEPAVIRLIEMPNQIVLEDIRGAVDAKLITHSYKKIKNPSNWSRQFTSHSKIIKIRVSNIIGGIEENTGDILPDYLKSFAETDSYQLARSKNSIQQEVVTPLPNNKRAKPGMVATYDYEFMLNDLYANYLFSYSGNPNVDGSGHYNGGLVFCLKNNGVYHNGKVSHQLITSVINNVRGEENGINKPYKFNVIWKSTGTAYKSTNDNNNLVVITIENSTGAERINVVNLNTIK